MKTIGLLGGMSNESTTEYYKKINMLINEKVGGSTSAKIVLHSFDFGVISKLQSAGRWDELTDMLVEKAKNLKVCGADFICICANTMHLMAQDIENRVDIEVLHIASATANEIKKCGLKKVALLGTKYVMQGDFYIDILNKNGIEVVIPNEADMDEIHRIIFDELVVGNINDVSKQKYIEIIQRLQQDGVAGVVLGCTEIPLLVSQDDLSIPAFDTMDIHCKAICDKALKV